MKSFITIIICTYNRFTLLDKALESLANQTLGKSDFQVLIIDNNSNDNTREIVEKWRNKLDLKYIFEPKQGLSQARNRGIIEAKTEYIGFIDDDAIADPDWIKNTINIIERDRPQIFGGPIYPFYQSKKPKWFLDRYETRSYGEKIKTLDLYENLSGSNIFFKRNIFKIIGWFDPSFGMKGSVIGLGEESQLQRQAKDRNIRVIYYPNLKVIHLVPGFKVKVAYIIKRCFMVGKVDGRIGEQLRLGVISEIYYLIREIIITALRTIIYWSRDKKKHPYWQNYFIYCLTPLINRMGRIYLYFFK